MSSNNQKIMMSNSVKKNIFYQEPFGLSARILFFAIIGIIQLSITSRILTPVDFGIYAIALFFFRF